MKSVEKPKENTKNTGVFVGFVLLSSPTWDKKQLIQDLKTEWDIHAIEDNDGKESIRDDTLLFYVGEKMVTLSLMAAPIPNGEAEINAENNYMWPDAKEATKSHQAHILVAVLGKNSDTLDRGKLFVKLISCCCKQKNIIGVYTSGTVFEPAFYRDMSQIMRDDELPIFNWIWFGIYQTEKGVCCYTYGMDVFGKEEMEVLDADAHPADVRDFLYDLVAYVLEYNVILKHGETIGFSAEEKHAITFSKGVSLPKMTLKIAYERQYTT